MQDPEITLLHCRTHNLKNVSLSLPKNQLLALTGVSGSGKSSLAIDTLYAEGQRRYMESLGHKRALPRADVERICHLSPTIAISQHQVVYDQHQTPAHIVEIYDLLALLLVQMGTFHSPTTGLPLKRDTPPQMVEKLLQKHPEGTPLQILAPIRGGPLREIVEQMEKMGYTRARIDNKIFDISSDPLPEEGLLDIIVDRLVLKSNSRSRLSDSMRLALELGRGRLIALTQEEEHFSLDYYCPAADLTYPKITIKDFRPLQPSALFLRLQGENISDLIRCTPPQLLNLSKTWNLGEPLASELLPRIQTMLQTLIDLALEDLPLDCPGPHLSLGQAQRLQIGAELSSDLSGILYILDEPTRGLLLPQVDKLIALLQRLKDNGNTLLIVTHHPKLIAASDHVIEMGPGAGIHGGEVIFEGPYPLLLKSNTPTGLYLSKRKKIKLGVLHLVETFPNINDAPVVRVDQSPIGRNLRSLPISYIGAWASIRALFAQTPLARARGLTASHFSLTKKGGRCEGCEGLGVQRLKMGFLPDISLPCPLCAGKRYNFETLQVTWKGIAIDELLNFTFEQALDLFEAANLKNSLQLAVNVGLGYLQLGQPFTTLSGGEMQRLKLIADLAHPAKQPTHYFVEEPSTSLHPQDLDFLLQALQQLVVQGHHVWITDPNLPALL
ncbi:MAG: hypothetical protein JSR80_01155 [Verrucomicrobia bacterium]|nr:hypothetical protein [Verrucomicrobiota bacterium]